MNDKDISQFFKDAYEFEHQRKDALNARLSLIFTALVVIIGAETYFINNINFNPTDIFKIIFFILLAMTLISIVFTFYFLCKCLFSFKYRYVSRPNKIINYITDLEIYNEKSSKSIDINRKIENLLNLQHSNSASKNRDNNKIKNGYFIRALKAIFVASIFVGLSAIPYYIIKVSESKKIVYVNIKNFLEISKMLDGKETDQNTSDPKPEPEPELEPIEPTPPDTEDINEADVSSPDIETKTEPNE